MMRVLSSLKLMAGRLSSAWRDYPAVRRELRALPPGPPIFVTGTHRSGTTWYAKMLAARGLWYIHEPFNPNKRVWQTHFPYVARGTSAPDIDRLMATVLDGGFRQALMLANTDHALMPLRLFPQPVRRIMIKDPLACLLTDYLTSRFGFQTTILFRHPAGFSASVCRLAWPRGEHIRRLLDCQPLMSDHLDQHAHLMESHAGTDTVASAAVLHGALNTVLWHFAQAGVGEWFRFEDVCLDPISHFESQYQRLGLPYNQDVARTLEVNCFDRARSVETYHPHAVRRNSRAMADSWKQQLSADEVARIRDIWEQFEIPLYRDDQEWSLDQAPTDEPAVQNER
jgi:hypothetical protein